MKRFLTLMKTELKLSLRGLDMLIFAVIFPVVMVILLGMIYGNSPAYSGASYTFLEQSFGALVSISICAGGAMGLPLLISEYRQKKILKRFQVTPVSPVLLLCVHSAIYALYALVSLALVYSCSAAFFGYRMQGSAKLFFLSYLLVMMSIFSIGLVIGGTAPDLKSAGIIASILYFPMMIFSGATLPYEIMPLPLQRVSDILPLTQAIKLLKSASLGIPLESAAPVIYLIILFICCSAAAANLFKWE
ncbi:ABC transporter permease [Clostridium sp. AM58-1XD]|uniref:ABC transporter permease n=1 Tax=Clostridium sp. AM58-1XD TaxID=2292307 RepID=UPI000E52E8CD|nr:ABC transporter permease [Clostridium sp. AM58-1XD]RGY97370.1 ABC transporter permease [Clostridium sp. AM58-1XD]